MTSEIATHPPVMWAQRKDVIFLTFNVESKDPEIRIEKQSVYFKGIGAPEKKLYEVTINLYADIVPEDCTTNNKGRCIQIVLIKENKKASFWPTLTNDTKKLHWLKVDFSKMQDENDSGDEIGGGKNLHNLEDMMRSMGGLDQMSDKPSFEDLTTDSDDEDLPDLE